MRTRTFTRTSIVLSAFLVVLPQLSAGRTHRLALAPGDQAPSLRGRSFGGPRVSARYEKQRLTVVNFWATWCAPCKEEMPALQRLHEEQLEGLQIIGVITLDPTTDEEMQSFAETLGITYLLVKPDDQVHSDWGGIGALPTTFLINQDGVILRRYVGANGEQIEGLVYDIRAALEGRPLGPFILPEAATAVTDEDRRQIQKPEQP